MAKKKKKVSDSAKSVEKKDSEISFIPKDQNAIISMAIFLIIGLIVGALITYGAGLMSNPVAGQVDNNCDDIGQTSHLSEAELSIKVQDYLNNYLVMDDSVLATVISANSLEDGVYELGFNITEDGNLVGNGLVYASDNLLFLGQVFNLNEPLEIPEEEEPVTEDTPVETKELTDEDKEKILSFNNCLAEKGIVVYGANWCGYTKNLVENLGGFSLVSPIYVECTEEEELCSEQQVTGYPTVKLNGEKINPTRTFQGFAEVTGCAVPELSTNTADTAYSGGC